MNAGGFFSDLFGRGCFHIRPHFGWQCVEVCQNQFSEQSQFFRLLFGRFIKFMQGLVAFQANLVRPCLQVFCDQALIRKRVNSLIELPGLDFLAQLFRANVNCSSKHGNSRRVALVLQIIHALDERTCGGSGDIFRTFTLWGGRKNILNREIRFRANISGVVLHDGIEVFCVEPDRNREETYRATTKQVAAVGIFQNGDFKRDVEGCISGAAMRAIMNENSHGK